MIFAGVVGVIENIISFEIFDVLSAVFLAIIGAIVIGAELQWRRVLKHAPFLSNYFLRGMFFFYVAIPLLQTGWQVYKHCVMVWDSGECPQKTPDQKAKDTLPYAAFASPACMFRRCATVRFHLMN